MRLTLKATVANIQFGKVFLLLPNGEQITISREQWIGAIEIGQEIALVLSAWADAEKDQAEFAKQVINQLIADGS